MSVVAVPANTNDTAGARRIAGVFARTRAEGRAALIPYVVAGYPDADASFAIACAAIDAGADLLEVGLPYSDPLADGATLQRASQGALAVGATFERSLALVGRIAAARPATPLVAMGYANQLIGGGDGRDRATALARAGTAGVIVADITPDEGEPFETVAAEAGIAVIYLVAPTTAPDRRAWIAGRSSGFLYCVSLVGVTGARRALPPTVAADPRRQGGFADTGRRGLRCLEAGAGTLDRAGGCRWRDRGLGAGRCARPGGSERGRPRIAGHTSTSGNRTLVPHAATLGVEWWTSALKRQGLAGRALRLCQRR